MTMIGLVTGAPPATSDKPIGDAKSAAGFGSALKGALDALVGDAWSTNSESAQSDVQTEEAVSVELAPSVEAQPLAQALIVIPSSVEETPSVDSILPAGSVSSTDPAAIPPADSELPDDAEVPDATGGASTALTTAVSPTSLNSPTGSMTPLVEPARAPAVSVLSDDADGSRPEAGSRAGVVSTGFAGPASGTGTAEFVGSTTPPVELVETPPGSPARSVDPDRLPAVAGSREVSTNSTSSTNQPTTGGSTPAAVPAAKPAPSNSVPSGQEARTAASASRVDGIPPISTSVTSEASPNRESSPTPILQPAAAPTGAPAPTGTAAPVAPATPAAPAASVPAASVPFGAQLSKPIFSLASAGAGEHVMTVSVTPDNLGPVTVRAHVGPEGVRVELFAPSELGRDAIRAILPDLRRDLAGAGLGGNLNLSSQNQPSEQSNQGQSALGDRGAGRGETARDGGAETPADSAGTEHEPGQRRPGLFGVTSTIDVLA